MYCPDGDPVGKQRMIHRQTSYDHVVLTESYEVCRLIVTNETSYDSVVLTKDIGSYEACRLMVTNEKQRKKMNKLNWSITRCVLKPDKSWVEYRALTKILACRPTSSGRASDINKMRETEKKNTIGTVSQCCYEQICEMCSFLESLTISVWIQMRNEREYKTRLR